MENLYRVINSNDIMSLEEIAARFGAVELATTRKGKLVVVDATRVVAIDVADVGRILPYPYGMGEAKEEFIHQAGEASWREAIDAGSISPYWDTENAQEAETWAEKQARAWWEWRFEGEVFPQYCPETECPSRGQAGCDCYDHILGEWTVPFEA